MAKKEQDQEFLESVVKALVENPDDVSVARTVDEMGVLLTLKVNPQDVGLVIGREGSVAKALRLLTKVVGMKIKARVNVRIEQPEGSARNERPRSGGFRE